MTGRIVQVMMRIMIKPIKTIKDIFSQLGNARVLSDQLGRDVWTVRKWRQRNSIPSDAWAGVIKVAGAKGVDLTLEKLMAIHKRPARRRASHSSTRRVRTRDALPLESSKP